MTVRGTPDRTRAARGKADYGSFLRNSPTPPPRARAYALTGVGNSGDRIRGDSRDPAHRLPSMGRSPRRPRRPAPPGRPAAGVRTMRSARELCLAEGQHPVGRDREYQYSPVASRVQKAVLAHFEPRASVPFHHPGLGEATERVVIGDLNRPALDHQPGTTYSASAGRMARGEPVIGTAGEPLAPRPRTSLAAPSRPRLIAARSPALSARCAGYREAGRGSTGTIRRCLIGQRPAETSIADWRARCGGRPGLAD